MIDHSDASFIQPDVGLTIEYGEYIAATCVGCHGQGLSGGGIPGVPPDWPEAGNLTPDKDTGIGAWSEQEFRSFFENGTKPDGAVVDTTYMPWPIGQQFTDEEMGALWLFLRSLQPTPQGDH